MKYPLFVLIIVLLISNNSFSQHDLSFTITAPSGLSLRKAPSLKSNRIMIIPFGEKVRSQAIKAIRLDTIDNVAGAWHLVQYKNFKGYVFNAYLGGYVNICSPSFDGINDDFRITPVNDVRCETINYDPALQWYGLSYDPKTQHSRIEKVTPKVSLIPAKDFKGEVNYLEEPCNFITINTIEKGNFQMLLGSKNAIPISETTWSRNNTLITPHDPYNNPGKFIHPYERYALETKNHGTYYLMAYESAKTAKQANDGAPGIVRQYHLYLSNDDYPDISRHNEQMQDLSEALHTNTIYIEQYSRYRGPRLIWQGDINNDGFPDLLFFKPYMTEGCGGGISYQLLVSEKEGDRFRLKKVAEEHIGPCSGC